MRRTSRRSTGSPAIGTTTTRSCAAIRPTARQAISTRRRREAPERRARRLAGTMARYCSAPMSDRLPRAALLALAAAIVLFALPHALVLAGVPAPVISILSAAALLAIVLTAGLLV